VPSNGDGVITECSPNTLDKEVTFYRALGKEPNSGSACICMLDLLLVEAYFSLGEF
jgi:hypothetical protein